MKNHRKLLLAALTCMFCLSIVIAFVAAGKFQRAKTNLHVVASVPRAKEDVIANARTASSELATHPTQLVSQPLSASGQRNWTDEVSKAANLFSVVSEAARAAKNGDGRAACAVSDALAQCALFINMAHQGIDLNAQQFAKSPQWVRNMEEQKAARCKRLATDDPFSELPYREGGYPGPYWRALALTMGDELATVDDVSNKLNRTDQQSMLDRSTVEQLQAKLDKAVQSGDPEVLFQIGMLASNGRYFSDPLSGMALAQVGCDLGYDCSSNNPKLPWSNCKYNGMCPANADLAYFLQANSGESTYAHVYAIAQQLEQGIRQGEWSAVTSAVHLKNIPTQ